MIVRELVTLLGFRVNESGAKQYEEVFNRIKGLALKIGAAIGGFELIKSIIETTSAWQQQNLQLSYIIGNTEKAHALMLQLNELADRSPFTRDELGGYAKQLINFGFSVDEITPLMGRLSNIAVVLGKESIPLITESLARMKTRGYADARVMMELFHAGIPIQQELAKRFGVTNFQMNKLILEGRIGFRDVYDALMALTTGTGKFGGATEAWGRTFEGIWHRILGIFEKLKTSLGTTLLPVVEDLMNRFKDWLDVNKGHLADDMISFLNTLAEALGFIYGLIEGMLIKLGILPSGPQSMQTGPGATSYKPPDPLSRLLRGEKPEDILRNPTGSPQVPGPPPGLLPQARTAEQINNLSMNPTLVINGGLPGDTAQQQAIIKNLQGLMDKSMDEWGKKQYRKAAPSFAEGTQ